MFARDRDQKLLFDLLQLQADEAGLVGKRYDEIYSDPKWQEKYKMTSEQKESFLKKGATKIYHCKSISKKGARSEINEINRIFGFSIS